MIPYSRVIMMFIGIALLISGCRKGDDEDNVATAVNVRTALVTAENFTEHVGALGVVTARPGHSASLSAPAPTRITQVRVAEGQHVGKGETLIVFEQTIFREAARSADAKLVAAQRAYERAQTLSAGGILPRKEVEQAAADLASARADVAAARRTAELSVLRSPISGVVSRLSATLGESVDANQPLVDIVDPSALDIVLGMTPTDAGKIKTGDKVDVRAGQSVSGEPLGTGIVRDISAVLDSATRTVAVRVAMPSARRVLRVGETVFGDVGLSTRTSVITVPAESLVPEGDGFKVFVVDAKNVVHATPVTVGVRDQQRAEVTKGLSAGSRIVTYGAYGLEDGATVVPAK